jgi:hypothetical protein
MFSIRPDVGLPGFRVSLGDLTQHDIGNILATNPYLQAIGRTAENIGISDFSAPASFRSPSGFPSDHGRPFDDLSTGLNSPESVRHSPYGNPPMGPRIDFLTGRPIGGPSGTTSHPAQENLAAGQNCRAGYEACMSSGRPRITCLQLMYNCSQHGLPTIFAPGVWGRPG